jgi:hypothetical protein
VRGVRACVQIKPKSINIITREHLEEKRDKAEALGEIMRQTAQFENKTRRLHEKRVGPAAVARRGGGGHASGHSSRLFGDDRHPRQPGSIPLVCGGSGMTTPCAMLAAGRDGPGPGQHGARPAGEWVGHRRRRRARSSGERDADDDDDDDETMMTIPTLTASTTMTV